MEKYSREEIAQLYFNTSANNFSRKKERYLNHLSEYYEWHMEGRNYVLDKELKPWEPLRRGRPKTGDQIQEDYIKALHEIVDNDPAQKLNSGANLTRNAKAKNPNQICTRYNHQEDTMSRYFCKGITKEFPMSEKVWVKKKNDFEYELLSEEEQTYLTGLIVDRYPDNKISLLSVDELMAYNQKEISKKELNKKISERIEEESRNFYTCIIKKFKDKYGFIPIRAKNLEASAF